MKKKSVLDIFTRKGMGKTAQTGMLPHEYINNSANNDPNIDGTPESLPTDDTAPDAEPVEQEGVEDEYNYDVSPRDMVIKYDGENYEVKEILSGSYLPMLQTEGDMEFYISPDEETAGQAAKERWEDMMQNDPEEFATIIGTERLVQWAMGQSDSYGISSAREFLEVISTVPEEEFASYDSVAADGQITEAVANKLGHEFNVKNGWADCIIFRNN